MATEPEWVRDTEGFDVKSVPKHGAELAWERRLKEAVELAERGEKSAARRRLREVLDQVPECGVALRWLTRLAETPKEAVDYLRRLAELDPEDPNAKRRLAVALVSFAAAEKKEGRGAEARRCLIEATRTDSRCSKAWLLLASLGTSRSEVLRCLERAVEADPSDERARSWRQKMRPSPDTWRCSICLQTAERTTTCASCGALLSFSDLDAFARNTGAHQAKIVGAVPRLKKEAEMCSAGLARLALAHLNLNEQDAALACMKRLSLDRPSPAVEQVVKRLQARLGAAAAKPRVVLIDDSMTVRSLVQKILSKRCDVVMGATGLEGLTAIHERAPDLVLLDLTLPGIDGFQLLTFLHENGLTEDVPVIMLTGKDSPEFRRQAKRCGAVDYLVKPFESKVLIRAVQEQLLAWSPQS